MSAIYIVSFRSQRDGRWHTGTYELDMDRMTKSCLVADILSGQFENVDKIYECYPGESCTDITIEIAAAVFWELRNDNERCPNFLRNFIDDNLQAGDADRLGTAAAYE